MSFFSFAFPLILTVIIEFAVFLAVFRKNPKQLLFYSVLINSFTNPLANLAFSISGNFLLIEFAVFLAEIFLIRELFETNLKKAFIVSLLANAASAALWLMLGEVL